MPQPSTMRGRERENVRAIGRLLVNFFITASTKIHSSCVRVGAFIGDSVGLSAPAEKRGPLADAGRAEGE